MRNDLQETVSELFQPINEGSSLDLDEIPVNEANILEDITGDSVL